MHHSGKGDDIFAVLRRLSPSLRGVWIFKHDRLADAGMGEQLCRALEVPVSAWSWIGSCDLGGFGMPADGEAPFGDTGVWAPPDGIRLADLMPGTISDTISAADCVLLAYGGGSGWLVATGTFEPEGMASVQLAKPEALHPSIQARLREAGVLCVSGQGSDLVSEFRVDLVRHIDLLARARSSGPGACCGFFVNSVGRAAALFSLGLAAPTEAPFDEGGAAESTPPESGLAVTSGEALRFTLANPDFIWSPEAFDRIVDTVEWTGSRSRQPNPMALEVRLFDPPRPPDLLVCWLPDAKDGSLPESLTEGLRQWCNLNEADITRRLSRVWIEHDWQSGLDPRPAIFLKGRDRVDREAPTAFSLVGRVAARLVDRDVRDGLTAACRHASRIFTGYSVSEIGLMLSRYATPLRVEVRVEGEADLRRLLSIPVRSELPEPALAAVRAGLADQEQVLAVDVSANGEVSLQGISIRVRRGPLARSYAAWRPVMDRIVDAGICPAAHAEAFAKQFRQIRMTSRGWITAFPAYVKLVPTASGGAAVKGYIGIIRTAQQPYGIGA